MDRVIFLVSGPASSCLLATALSCIFGAQGTTRWTPVQGKAQERSGKPGSPHGTKYLILNHRDRLDLPHYSSLYQRALSRSFVGRLDWAIEMSEADDAY